MPKWLRKSFVILVTILTFGMVTPSQDFLYNNVNNHKPPKRDAFESDSVEKLNETSSEESNLEEIVSARDQFIQSMMKEAEEQSYKKFGPRIKPVIEDEFKKIILPNIERAIATVASQYPKEELSRLEITEVPGGGTSEKIFHIVDSQTKKDLIRFHVRRDHPPLEGYWFNFHYHTHHDNFQAHHHLGSIYWDKNTPPNWERV
ncbi:YpjP family protein [Bacillus methanolicus]|uniref:YpjP-like protein n=1 Tax=Bacillus methanolicus (strain MGA3 / ATCC 53907) TaxID=796606 RepID=I3E9M8_BACMM|nr:YpjP family protein [Bacillus methanolicus]AIE60448.1 hypothetical protein BMMGA3_10260 [Bacillus methanolicus MGA3]EIJ83199.1 hypothetical protein MGA3_08255 [Bacillus methanolicus MGA3]UQD52463.1 hypothetical protein C0971_10900 [Bacillus methanolicus]